MATLRDKLRAESRKSMENLDYLDAEVSDYLIADPLTPHEGHVDSLLRLSGEMQTRNERIAASEMIWGVASHAVENVAKERGWPTETHTDLSDVAEWIALEYGKSSNPDAAKAASSISSGFALAQKAHSNYYEDQSTPDIIRSHARTIQDDFLPALAKAHRDLPMGLEMPDIPRYRTLLLKRLQYEAGSYGRPERRNPIRRTRNSGPRAK